MFNMVIVRIVSALGLLSCFTIDWFGNLVEVSGVFTYIDLAKPDFF